MTKQLALTRLDNGLEVSTVQLAGGRWPIYETMTFKGETSKALDEGEKSLSRKAAQTMHLIMVRQMMKRRKANK